VSHPETFQVDDVWRIAMRCAGAGAGFVLSVHGLDEPLPTGHLSALVVETMREFGFEPSPNVAAYAQEFTP
jgi:hypothetical protein